MPTKLSVLFCSSLLVASLALPYTTQAKDPCEGIDVTATDEYEDSPIFLSLTYDDSNLALVETYLKCGADPNESSGIDWFLTTTEWAIYGGASIPMLELLIKYGGKIDYATVLSEIYTQNRNVEMLEYLIKKGASLSIRSEEDYYYEPSGNFIEDAGTTPLMNIAENNENPAIILALLRHGADATARDYRGRYAYDYAIKWNEGLENSEALQILKKAKEEDSKKDVLLKQDFWKDASLADVKKALKSGSNVHAKDNSLITPIMYAAQYNGNTEILKELVRQGADLNPADNRGQTVLFYAIRGKVNKEGISYLVNNGAKINHTDMLGNTALHLLSDSHRHFYLHEEQDYVRGEKYVEAGLSLLANGANVNIENNDGNTPLHLAAYNGRGYSHRYKNHQGFFKALLEANTDPSIKQDLLDILEHDKEYQEIILKILK